MRSFGADLRHLRVGTATRELIRANNLNVAMQENRSVRQTLGFREQGVSRRPKFTSDLVERLYKELDPTALGLPVESHEKLLQAWDNQTFAPRVLKIAEQLGPKIWEDAMDIRLPHNPFKVSQLLVSGEQDYCTEDLFWDFKEHRAFIVLQLEHLSFVRAFSWKRNHPDAIPKPIKTSLIVKLRLPNNLSQARTNLRDNAAVARKRNLMAFHEDNEAKGSGDWNNAKRRLNSSQEHRVVDVSSDEEGDPAFEGSENDEEHGEDYTIRRPFMRTSNSRHNDRKLSVRTRPTDDDLLSPRYRTDGWNTQSSCSAGVLTPSTPTNMQNPTPNLNLGPDLTKSRWELQTEMMNELYGEHVSSYSATLEEKFLRIWNADQEMMVNKLGHERYKTVNEAVQHWLGWRKIAGALGGLTGIKPFLLEEMPEYTYAEWIEMLGGEDRYRDVFSQLNDYRLRSYEDGSIQDHVSSLMEAFLVVTKQPIVVHGFESGLKAFHEQMRLWHVVFTGEDA